jgi:hypothetical protein
MLRMRLSRKADPLDKVFHRYGSVAEEEPGDGSGSSICG